MQTKREMIRWRFMANKLRYTGEWPPPEVLQSYPNWEMAYDEEGEDGQDESTLRPQAEQTFITDNTVHTAGDVLLADGRSFIAIITVPFGEPPESCSFHDGTQWWMIQKRRNKWEPFVATYLPEDKREPPLILSDSQTFPMRIKTRLPKAAGDTPWHIEIRPDGTEKEL